LDIWLVSFARQKLLPSRQQIFDRNNLFKFMDQLDLHTGKPPTASGLPVLTRTADAYKLWNNTLPRMPRLIRYSLGEKISSLFMDVMELILVTGYSSKEQKSAIVQKARIKLDLLKYFLQIAFELKAIKAKDLSDITVPWAKSGANPAAGKNKLLNKLLHNKGRSFCSKKVTGRNKQIAPIEVVVQPEPDQVPLVTEPGDARHEAATVGVERYVCIITLTTTPGILLVLNFIWNFKFSNNTHQVFWKLFIRWHPAVNL
jgi:hypothetical protein